MQTTHVSAETTKQTTNRHLRETTQTIEHKNRTCKQLTTHISDQTIHVLAQTTQQTTQRNNSNNRTMELKQWNSQTTQTTQQTTNKQLKEQLKQQNNRTQTIELTNNSNYSRFGSSYSCFGSNYSTNN